MSDFLRKVMKSKGVVESTGPTQINPVLNPNANIKVIWVWGWWSNAVNRMIDSWIKWIQFIAMNTDSQSLSNSKAEKKITLWKAATRWLWAWWNPQMWKIAAEESTEDIKKIIEWSDMVFITCGLWWWTGTWAAPVVAEIAREMWILTVWVVTKPFSFEWQRRLNQALSWFEELKNNVDTLITIPNDKVLSIIDKKTPLTDAFMVVDDILKQWISWVSELITWNGLINVDFADVKAIMENAGSALMWIWYGSWESRASDAARSAIDSPLLELSINWAKWVLINVTWWSDLSMFEVDEAAKIITDVVSEDANIIFWAVIDEEYAWEIKVTVLATWFENEEENMLAKNPFQKMEGLWNQRKSPFSTVTTPNRAITRNEMEKKSEEKPEAKKMWLDNSDLDVPAFMRKIIK